MRWSNSSAWHGSPRSHAPRDCPRSRWCATRRQAAAGPLWAPHADVVLALPGAQIGFAGSRVRPADADPAAYTAEAQLAAGHVDAVVRQEELRETLGRWLTLLTAPSDAPAHPPHALGRAELPATGWEAVQNARSADRPRAAGYLDAYFETREAISGDRCGGVDPGMLCGFGLHQGRAIAYAAQCGTATSWPTTGPRPG